MQSFFEKLLQPKQNVHPQPERSDSESEAESSTSSTTVEEYKTVLAGGDEKMHYEAPKPWTIRKPIYDKPLPRPGETPPPDTHDREAPSMPGVVEMRAPSPQSRRDSRSARKGQEPEKYTITTPTRGKQPSSPRAPLQEVPLAGPNETGPEPSKTEASGAVKVSPQPAEDAESFIEVSGVSRSPKSSHESKERESDLVNREVTSSAKAMDMYESRVADRHFPIERQFADAQAVSTKEQSTLVTSEAAESDHYKLDRVDMAWLQGSDVRDEVLEGEFGLQPSGIVKLRDQPSVDSSMEAEAKQIKSVDGEEQGQDLEPAEEPSSAPRATFFTLNDVQWKHTRAHKKSARVATGASEKVGELEPEPRKAPYLHPEIKPASIESLNLALAEAGMIPTEREPEKELLVRTEAEEAGVVPLAGGASAIAAPRSLLNSGVLGITAGMTLTGASISVLMRTAREIRAVEAQNESQALTKSLFDQVLREYQYRVPMYDETYLRSILAFHDVLGELRIKRPPYDPDPVESMAGVKRESVDAVDRDDVLLQSSKKSARTGAPTPDDSVFLEEIVIAGQAQDTPRSTGGPSGVSPYLMADSEKIEKDVRSAKDVQTESHGAVRKTSKDIDLEDKSGTKDKSEALASVSGKTPLPVAKLSAVNKPSTEVEHLAETKSSDSERLGVASAARPAETKPIVPVSRKPQMEKPGVAKTEAKALPTVAQEKKQPRDGHAEPQKPSEPKTGIADTSTAKTSEKPVKDIEDVGRSKMLSNEGATAPRPSVSGSKMQPHKEEEEVYDAKLHTPLAGKAEIGLARDEQARPAQLVSPWGAKGETAATIPQKKSRPEPSEKKAVKDGRADSAHTLESHTFASEGIKAKDEAVVVRSREPQPTLPAKGTAAKDGKDLRTKSETEGPIHGESTEAAATTEAQKPRPKSAPESLTAARAVQAQETESEVAARGTVAKDEAVGGIQAREVRPISGETKLKAEATKIVPAPMTAKDVQVEEKGRQAVHGPEPQLGATFVSEDTKPKGEAAAETRKARPPPTSGGISAKEAQTEIVQTQKPQPVSEEKGVKVQKEDFTQARESQPTAVLASGDDKAEGEAKAKATTGKEGEPRSAATVASGDIEAKSKAAATIQTQKARMVPISEGKGGTAGRKDTAQAPLSTGGAAATDAKEERKDTIQARESHPSVALTTADGKTHGEAAQESRPHAEGVEAKATATAVRESRPAATLASRDAKAKGKATDIVQTQESQLPSGKEAILHAQPVPTPTSGREGAKDTRRGTVQAQESQPMPKLAFKGVGLAKGAAGIDAPISAPAISGTMTKDTGVKDKTEGTNHGQESRLRATVVSGGIKSKNETARKPQPTLTSEGAKEKAVDTVQGSVMGGSKGEREPTAVAPTQPAQPIKARDATKDAQKSQLTGAADEAKDMHAPEAHQPSSTQSTLAPGTVQAKDEVKDTVKARESRSVPARASAKVGTKDETATVSPRKAQSKGAKDETKDETSEIKESKDKPENIVQSRESHPVASLSSGAAEAKGKAGTVQARESQPGSERAPEEAGAKDEAADVARSPASSVAMRRWSDQRYGQWLAETSNPPDEKRPASGVAKSAESSRITFEASSPDVASEASNLAQNALVAIDVARELKGDVDANGRSYDWTFWSRLIETIRQNPYSDRIQALKPSVVEHVVNGQYTGVPEEARKMVWLYLSDNHVPNNMLGVVAHENAPASSMVQKQVQLDVSHTFPEQKEYDAKRQRLTKVLQTYSNEDPAVGYCSALALVTGVLALELDESQSLILLKRMMFHYDLRRQYLPGMEGTRMRTYQFEKLLERFRPELAQHLTSLGWPCDVIVGQWFSTCFAYRCPLDLVYQIYDLFLLEGYAAFFKVALAFHSENEPALMAATTKDEVLAFFADHVLDAHGRDYKRWLEVAGRFDISEDYLASLAESFVGMARNSQALGSGEDLATVRTSNQVLSAQVRHLATQADRIMLDRERFIRENADLKLRIMSLIEENYRLSACLYEERAERAKDLAVGEMEVHHLSALYKHRIDELEKRLQARPSSA